MQLLNDYSNLEEDYYSSLSEVTNALNGCLVKLPTTENAKVIPFFLKRPKCLVFVIALHLIIIIITRSIFMFFQQADVNELKDIFQETMNVFNSLSPNIQICLPEVLLFHRG